jgi:hypothetical protein
MTTIKINTLPLNTVNEIKELLTCFNSVFLSKNTIDNTFEVNTCNAISVGSEEVYIGEILASDVFQNHQEWISAFIYFNPNQAKQASSYKPKSIKLN